MSIKFTLLVTVLAWMLWVGYVFFGFWLSWTMCEFIPDWASCALDICLLGAGAALAGVAVVGSVAVFLYWLDPGSVVRDISEAD